jgi:hypothetical protein
MPTRKATKPKTASRKVASAKKSASPKKSAEPKMSDSQRAIYNKLKRKGMTDAQAHAFSKHAARRKDSAAAKKSAGTARKGSRKGK